MWTPLPFRQDWRTCWPGPTRFSELVLYWLAAVVWLVAAFLYQVPRHIRQLPQLSESGMPRHGHGRPAGGTSSTEASHGGDRQARVVSTSPEALYQQARLLSVRAHVGRLCDLLQDLCRQHGTSN